MFETASDGGNPLEKSSGFATSIRTLPDRCSAPAASSAAIEAIPAVAFTSSSPNAAASAKVPCVANEPASAAHAAAASLSAVLEPILTSWPSSTSLEEIVRPAVPVPSTPNSLTPPPRSVHRFAAAHLGPARSTPW